MLESLRCVNYRAFADFTVTGLGRVNLVVGGNNAGKSSLLAATGAIATGYPFSLPWPLDRADTDDYGHRIAFWRPMFRDGDEERGLVLHGTVAGDARRLDLRALTTEEATIRGPEAWWYRTERAGQTPARADFRFDGRNLILSRPWPPYLNTTKMTYSRGFGGLSDWDRRTIAELAQEGRLATIAEVLRNFDRRIHSLELIGDDVMVALEGIARRLPVGVLGDGSLRILDIALAVSANDTVHAAFDEIDAGLHHSALSLAWGILRSARPLLQIFATTHRDECVQAAAQTFLDANDDGLRVIRIDRQNGEHKAVLYTAAEALEAIQGGWDVRG